MAHIDSAAETGDRGYRDAIAKVEPYGVDHIPDSERHGRPSSQFFTWFGGNLTLPLLLLGFWPIYFGLSLPEALLAIAAGTAAGALLMGVLAAMGTRLGLPQQVQARGPLGYYGNYPPVAIVNVFAAVGWAVVNTIIGAQALHELLGVPSSVGIVAISVLQGLLVVFGYNMIHFVNRIGSVLLGVLFLSITVVALTKAHWTTHSDPHAPFFVGTTGGWITSAGYFFSFLLAWAPFASDYSRYLPASTSGRRVRLNTAAGNFCAIFWLGAVGALVASAVGQAGVIESVKHLTGDFAPLAMLTIVVSTFPVNGLNLYGGAISLLTLRAPVSRRTAAVIATVLTMVLSLWLSGDIYAKFHDFLVASGYLIAPWVTVVFLDYFLAGRVHKIKELYDRSRTVEWGFLAWFIGCAASLPFWTSNAWTGPIAHAHPGLGDVSYYIGGAAAAVVYLLTYRLSPLSGSLRRHGRHTGQPAQAGLSESGASSIQTG
ncbi:purine-cytosine permease family protein [Spirillospora sp. CA-128828]|uniref:purine-cytosine permease family protein n=1 Tax=Spirillospora sp. CA-128828 TaxID=3240033 RepID=UPI003D8E16EE